MYGTDKRTNRNVGRIFQGMDKGGDQRIRHKYVTLGKTGDHKKVGVP